MTKVYELEQPYMLVIRCTFVYFFVDSYSPITWFGFGVAASLGRR